MKKVLFSILFAGLMAWTGVANAQLESNIRVGSLTDSTPFLPMNTSYKYSYSQMIYDYNAMPSPPGPIKLNSISFYYTGHGATNAAQNRQIVVYMKNINNNFFNTDSAYVPVTADDRVFCGAFQIPATAGWVTIHLQKQFVYKNQSGTHLFIGIYDSTGTYSSRYFRQRENGGLYGGLSYESDNASYKPNPEASLANYRGQKYRRDYLPDLKITYTYDSAARLPYTTNFSNTNDNAQWSIRNWVSPKNAHWYFFPNPNSPTMLMCGYGQDDYFTSGYPTTNVAERTLQLGYSDSIKVQFHLNVGGESGNTYAYDYLSVFMVPADTVWKPSSSKTYYTGGDNDSTLRYALYFKGRASKLASLRLTSITNQTVSTTFENPCPGKKCKLVFVWRNDNSQGDGTAPTIDDLAVTEVNRLQEYTPQSTKQWYGYAYSVQDNYGVRNPLMEHFIAFNMQNLTNADTASVHFSEDVMAATYAENKVWYTIGGYNDRITSANMNASTRYISGSINYQFVSSLSNYVSQLAYNPADDNMYFTTDDGELYRFPMSDPEHYTLMGSMSFNPSAFAINAQGEAYATDGEDETSLYRVNLANANTTLVGSMGLEVGWYSSMAFDYSTGELFLAAYNYTRNNDYGTYLHTGCGFYNVNTSTGATKYIGKIAGNKYCEMTGLFAVQTAGQQGIATAQATELSVYPNPAKDQLQVNGVETNTLIRIYDMTGKVVMQQTATENTIINVSELNRGVYMVSAGASKVKFVKE